MRLSRLLPLFVLLVTVVSLMPPAFAATDLNLSRSNTYRTMCSGTGPVTGSVTITFTADGTLTQPAAVTDTCIYSVAAKAPAAKSVKTNLPANGADVVTIVSDDTARGGVSSYRCSQHVNTTPNVLVQVQCKDPTTGAAITVEVTTNVPRNG